jgi:hypothetical protein
VTSTVWCDICVISSAQSSHIVKCASRAGDICTKLNQNARNTRYSAAFSRTQSYVCAHMFGSWGHTSAEKRRRICHKLRIQHVYCLETKPPRFEFANKISYECEVGVQFDLCGQVQDKVDVVDVGFELVLQTFNISKAETPYNTQELHSDPSQTQ